MLLLISIFGYRIGEDYNLNTSNVTVNQSIHQKEKTPNLYLNTSNVTVNRWVLNIPILGDIYLNTSNVTVNLYFKFIYKGVFTNLNTSNVTVNPIGRPYEGDLEKFKYI